MLDKVKFPSPYGVTVIKSRNWKIDYVVRNGFPSPYGVTVIKSGNSVIDYGFKSVTFPSPYGVTVIKSCRNELLSESIQ